jgi:Fuc2NAc and GlcNAc transferase
MMLALFSDWWMTVTWLLLSSLGSAVMLLLLGHFAVLDHPGPRRLHQRPVVRGGGLTIVLLVVAYLLQHDIPGISMPWLLLALLCAAITGFIDDIAALAAAIKLPLLAVAAVLAVLAIGAPTDSIELPSLLQALTIPLLWLVAALMVVAILWMMNLFNFMDGSNGLSAGQVILCCAGLLLFANTGTDPGLNALTSVVMLVTLGFLPWNFPRARMFLGDVGSLSLGLLVAVLLLSYWQLGALSFWAALLLPAVFLVDATATLLMRIANHRKWYQAHTDHAYQQLILQGWTHAQVWLLYVGCNVLLVWPGVYLMTKLPGYEWLLAMSLLLVLSAGWCLVQSRSQQRSFDARQADTDTRPAQHTSTDSKPKAASLPANGPGAGGADHV